MCTVTCTCTWTARYYHAQKQMQNTCSLSLAPSYSFIRTEIFAMYVQSREHVLGFCWHKAYLCEHHRLLCVPDDPKPFKWAWGLRFYGLNGVNSRGTGRKREVLKTTSKHFIFSSSTLRAFVSSSLHLLPSLSVGPPCLDTEKTRGKKTDREDTGASYLKSWRGANCPG